MVGAGAIFLCACNTDQQLTAGGPDVPYDYRQRHPITMTEGNQTLEVFVGTSQCTQVSLSGRFELCVVPGRWVWFDFAGLIAEPRQRIHDESLFIVLDGKISLLVLAVMLLIRLAGSFCALAGGAFRIAAGPIDTPACDAR